MIKFLRTAIAGVILLSGAAASAQTVEPFTFDNDRVMAVTINGPIKTLQRRSRSSTKPYDATISIPGYAPQPITMAARGKSRRTEFCRFAPLRISFDKNAIKASGQAAAFPKQKSLKLVTHCRDKNSRATETVLLEYAAYELYALISPHALRARRVDVSYIDSGKEAFSGVAFFIEDADDAAKRNGIKEADIGRISRGALDPQAASDLALFQWLIGNLDWSMLAGASKHDCCHNVKLMGDKKSATSGLIPVAYDFDHSGLVSAFYARPPAAHSDLRNVKERKYVGFCDHSAYFDASADKILARRYDMMAVIDRIDGLSDRKKADAKAYLQSGFDVLASPDRREKIKKDCR